MPKKVYLILVVAAFAPAILAADEAVDFARDIAPLLESRCIRCHQPGNTKGDVSLATIDDLAENGYVVAGDPSSSYLIQLVTAEGDKPPEMPKQGDPLSADELALVQRWIAQGAKWPEEVVLRERSKADGSWWSLVPLASADPNATIDALVGAKLAENKLALNPPADRRTLIRRATYDLTGLPPTPEEALAFVQDSSPDAYERLIDRLLASPHYGERWGRHWLDVIRFGESNGFERNVIIDNLWPFRDYVIRSLNEGRPFNRFIQEHLAGDAIGPGDPEVEVGTSFLVCGPYDDVGNEDPVQAAQIRANTIDEIIRAASEAFLGLTVGCARCHDHKFDPIAQEDYYGLYATFAGTFHGARTVARPETRQAYDAKKQPLDAAIAEATRQRTELLDAIVKRAEAKRAQYEQRWTRPPVDRYGTEEQFPPVEAQYVRLIVDSTDADPYGRTGFYIDEFEVWTAGDGPQNVALASAGGRAEGDSRVAEDFAGAYAADRTIDGKFGVRWVATGSELVITLAQPQRIDRVVFSSDREQALDRNNKTTFVGDYRLEVSLDAKSWTGVADSSDRKPPTAAHERQRWIDYEQTGEERDTLAQIDRLRAEIRRELAELGQLPSWWVGDFRTADGPFCVFRGGDPQQKAAEVAPASFQVLGDSHGAYRLKPDAAERERRLALARWIVADENPLTARVLANRLWHYHFGTGIVDTPSDFGYMGGRPTHPELLDWLAVQIHRHGWRLKPLHKLIMMSQAYRQSSVYREDAAAVDADARLLWRYPPRRLSAEEIRDTILNLSGRLDTKMGGPGFRLYRYLQDNVATYVPLDEHGPATWRRAVYHQNARAAPVDLMAEFDGPDCAFSAPRRSETTTPLQALTMLNHRFTLDMAAALAERIASEVGDQPEAQLRRAYALAYSREPSADETIECVGLIDAHGLRAFCRVLLNTSELIYVK